MMNKRTYFVLTVALILVCSFFVSSVGAIVAEVQNVTFSTEGEDTILQVTIYHTPVSSFHYVDQVEVDIDGTITSYPVTQTQTTFTASINLGQISGTPAARVRVFCTIDGWSSWTSQQTIPEFPTHIMVPLVLATALVTLLYKKRINKPMR